MGEIDPIEGFAMIDLAILILNAIAAAVAAFDWLCWHVGLVA
jgi:hypothetical protein